MILSPFLCLYLTYLYFSHDLPDLSNITGYKPKLITEIYSSKGVLIGEFASERRKIVQTKDVPLHVIQAFIATEDRRFFEHRGLDLKGIIRAVITNIQKRDLVTGGSTITQQVTKNLILTPEKTISRKIKEAILAYRMESNLSKEEILYIYLNHIYLADGTYGVEAASKNYFGKSVRNINLAEAAMLAGLPKRPEYYSPRKNFERSKQRQKLILKLMEEQQYITSEQRTEAENYEIKLVPKRYNNAQIAPYFVEFVRQYLENKFGTRAYINGGYTVYTTIDIEQSLSAQWALRRGILGVDKRRGRGFVLKKLRSKQQISTFRNSQKIDRIIKGATYKGVVLKLTQDKTTKIYTANIGIMNREGMLKFAVSKPFGTAIKNLSRGVSEKYALLTGYNGVSLSPVELKIGDVVNVGVIYEKDGAYVLSLNHIPVTQGALLTIDRNGFIKALVGGYDFKNSQFNRATQALRQPGSAFKPIVYSAALDRGYTETTVVYDIPVVIKDWIPSNYDGNYMGAITLRKALAKSRNLASVRILLDLDPADVANYAKKFGFTSRLNPYPSLALGGSDVTLLEMVASYHVFASGGKYIKPEFILRIYDRNGMIVEDNATNKYMTKKESQKFKRENKREKILERLAKAIGKDINKSEEFIIEINLDDDVMLKDNDVFLSSNEFLELLQNNSIEFLYENDGEQIISPQTSYIMTDLLQAVVQEGTGQRAKSLNSLAPIAGKTGTTNDFTDAWFIGYSPKIIAGVWVGRDNHKTLGKKEAGSRAALPIWIDFMKDALLEYPGGEFEMPHGIQYVETPYGPIPYSTDSLIKNVLLDLEKMQSPYSNKSYEELKELQNEVEIDFLLRR